MALQVADDHAVVMALVDRNLVDAYGTRRQLPRPTHLFGHAQRGQVLDRPVVQPLQLGHGRVGRAPAQIAHLQGESRSVARVLDQLVQPLYGPSLCTTNTVPGRARFKSSTQLQGPQGTHTNLR